MAAYSETYIDPKSIAGIDTETPSCSLPWKAMEAIQSHEGISCLCIPDGDCSALIRHVDGSLFMNV